MPTVMMTCLLEYLSAVTLVTLLVPFLAITDPSPVSEALYISIEQYMVTPFLISLVMISRWVMLMEMVCQI